MTREEEDRRLALSTAIAQINAAIDALAKVDRAAMPGEIERAVIEANVWMLRASREGSRRLEELKAKHAAETPKEDR